MSSPNDIHHEPSPSCVEGSNLEGSITEHQSGEVKADESVEKCDSFESMNKKEHIIDEKEDIIQGEENTESEEILDHVQNNECSKSLNIEESLTYLSSPPQQPPPPPPQSQAPISPSPPSPAQSLSPFPHYHHHRRSLDQSPPRFVTLEDIKALEEAARGGGLGGTVGERGGGGGVSVGVQSESFSKGGGGGGVGGVGIFDFTSSSVVVIDTKARKQNNEGIFSYRKRSLSLSPGLGSRSEASSDGSLQRSTTGGGLYTWVRTSLRKRRLRKKAKKSLNLNFDSPAQSDVHNLDVPPASLTARVTHHSSASTSNATYPDTRVTYDPKVGGGRDASVGAVVFTPEVLNSQDGTSCEDTYVNHRNGHVTLVTAGCITKAQSQKFTHPPSKTSPSYFHNTQCSGGVGYSYVNIPQEKRHTRARSTSVGRRVLLSTTSQTKTKKGKKRNRVLGGAWGLFHCAGAGARSRSCTPERNVNYRVRSRSATPERLNNLRVYGLNGGVALSKSGGKKQTSKKGKKMKGRSKSKTKTGRRRVSVSSEDDNKENIYDMWRLIKGKMLDGTPKKGYACDRLSRIDSLPNRPRGSVNINRDNGEIDFSDPEFQICLEETNDVFIPLRSQSERRYCHKTAPLPVDTHTFIQKAPPTDLNFNQCNSFPMSKFENGEVFRPPKSATSQTSVTSSSGASSTSDYGSCKDSVISVCSGRTGSTGSKRDLSAPPLKNRSNTLPARYRDRPLPPIPKPDAVKVETPLFETPSDLPPKPLEAGPVQLVKTIKLDKIMKNKWVSAVAVTRKNELIVVDLREAYLLDAEGNLKRTIGACSSRNSGSLKEPIDVAVMSNGNLLFSDHSDQAVKIYTTKGHFVRKIVDRCLANIAGVATSEKKVFIAGTDKRCVTVHSEEEGLLYSIPSKDATSSSSLLSSSSSLFKDVSSSSMSSKESTLGGKAIFEHPYSIAINPLTGDIIVGDDYRQRVIAVSQDGRVLWRYSPTGDRHFFPCSIAVDSEGYIFIADLYNEKIYMLDSSGKPLKVLLSRCEGLKGGPGALAVDGRGHLIVADEERTLKVFKYGHKGFTMYRRISMCPEYK